MKERYLLDRLERFGPADYVGRIRAHGRAQLDPEVRGHMAELYGELRPMLRKDRLSPTVARVLRVAMPAFESEWKLNGGGEASTGFHRPLDTPGLRYLSYANVRVLNSVIGTNRHATDRDISRGAWGAIQYIANTWLAYETRTVVGTEDWNQERLPRSVQLYERMALLSKLAELAAHGLPPDPMPAPTPPQRWVDLPGHPELTLEFLTTLPQTLQHDEVLFLRSIHLTECCLAGTLVHVMSAIEFLKRKQLEFAAVCLARARKFAIAQSSTVRILETMSPEAFIGFREDTGDASAVQSLTNQLLMIHVLGVEQSKIEAMASIPELSYVLQYANPSFVPLKRALQELDRSATGADDVLQQARSLDADMCRWRAAHYGLAARYLPDDTGGTGGTSGAPYLKRFYLNRLFQGDELDMTPVPIPEVPADALRQRARPILGWDN